MRPFALRGGCCLLTALTVSTPADAGTYSASVREAAEYVLRRCGKKAPAMGLDVIAQKTDQLVVQHGPKALEAVRKVGPQTFRLIGEAGGHGHLAVHLLAQHGPQAAGIVSRREALALVARHGDDAAAAMIRHPGAAVPMIARWGGPAASAVRELEPQNARRLALMDADGNLARVGRTGELLAVIAQYGDRACDWIWRNKEALTIASVLGAFLADPEPFLDGVRDLTVLVAETVARPIAEVPRAVATEAARQMNWKLIALVAGSLVGLAWFVQRWHQNRHLRQRHMGQSAG
jgi:NADPH:quinone reductase-like Zn-dependent oxidoreductase